MPAWLRTSVALPVTHEAHGRRLVSKYRDNYRFWTFGEDVEPKWWRRHGSSWLSKGGDRHLRDCWLTLRDRLLEEAPLDAFNGEVLRRIAFLNSARNAHDCNLILAAAAKHIGPPA